MRNVFRFIKQPSTLRGLSVLAGVLGFQFQFAAVEQIVTGVGCMLGAIEVLRDEDKPKAQ